MYRGKIFKKKLGGGKYKKKKVPVLLDPPGRYTGNNFFFKGGLSYINKIYLARFGIVPWQRYTIQLYRNSVFNALYISTNERIGY